MRRDFRCLFQGQVASQLGTQAFQVMALYYLARQTGTPGAGAAYLALGLIPPVLLGPWLTAWATRWRPRSVLVACDLLAAALTLPMIVALVAGAPVPVVVRTLLATTALMAAVNALMMPSVHAAIVRLVEPAALPRANTFVIVTQQLAGVIGQGAGGVLYALAGPIALCALTCAGFAGSAAWASRLRDPAVVGAAAASPVRPPAFALLKTHPAFRRLALVSALFNTLYAPWLVLLPFHLAPAGTLVAQTFGAALAAYGLGNVVGAFAMRGLMRHAGAALLGATLMFQAAGLCLLGSVHGVAAICAVLALMGAGIGVANTQSMTLAQRIVPTALVGQAVAVIRSTVQLATPLGFALVALAKTWLAVAPGAVYQACGVLLALALLPNLRALAVDGRAHDPARRVAPQAG